MPIDKKQLNEIDSNLDDVIKEFNLLKVSKDLALNSLLKHYEEYVSLEATEVSGDITEHNILSKQAQDGIEFAIQWIFKYCPINSRSTFNENKLKRAAKNLLEQAQEYSRVWDFMNLLFRDMCKAEISTENIVTLEYRADYRSEADIINRFLNEVDNIGTIADDLISLFKTEPMEIIREIDFKVNKKKELKYNLPDHIYVEIYKYNLTAKKHLFELNEDWELGGYTVKDIRKVFLYLRTISMIHMMGFMSVSAQKKIIRNPFIVKSQNEWLQEIKSNITIGDDECKKIFSELIYDYELYKTDKKKPDVTYQPFISFSNEKIALFNSLVQQSNFERNHWDLLSIIKPEIHSRLRNEKESLWLNELKEFLSKINLETNGPIDFTFKNQSSNIDLIVIDKAKKVIVIFELKWITSPDRIKDIVYLSEELKKGLTQVEHALNWIQNDLNDFSNKININTEELKDFKFFGLVLSKNSMGNGFTYKEDIPIINERILKWVLSTPHNKDIETLWKVGIEQRYMPKVDVHFRHTDYGASFAGYKFIGTGIGLDFIKHFDPNTDFDFEGL